MTTEREEAIEIGAITGNAEITETGESIEAASLRQVTQPMTGTLIPALPVHVVPAIVMPVEAVLQWVVQ
jgi:hypothetical protein